MINYYSLAWLDRHLKGQLVFDDDGNVVTTEAAPRPRSAPTAAQARTPSIG